MTLRQTMPLRQSAARRRLPVCLVRVVAMSAPVPSPRESTPLGNATGGGARTRIDPPHVLVAALDDRSTPPAETEADAVGATATSEQIQTQAAQLAEHLRSRQREVDHREARLNAQIARFEADARTARLILREREAALAEREQSLAGRLAPSDDTHAIAHDRRSRRRLEEAEAALAEVRAETERLRQSLLDDRAEFESQVRAERERAAAEWRRRLADLDAKRQRLHDKAKASTSRGRR